MNRSALSLVSGAALLALLAGCGKESPAPAPSGTAAAGPLGAQIAVDPGLLGESAAASDAPRLPADQRSPAAIEAARKDAVKLAGGTIEAAPAPSAEDSAPLAKSVAMINPDCADKARHAPQWANALPDALPVYPRAAVQDAAGTDEGGCRLRVVNFITPVAPGDVVNFYYTHARKAGYDAQHRLDGKDHVLGGAKERAAYVLYIRTLANGLTEVDLVSNAG